MMKSVTIAEAEAGLSTLVDEVRMGKSVIGICQRDQPTAYLIRAEEYEHLKGVSDSVRAVELRDALAGRRFDLREVIAELDLAAVQG